MWQTKSAAPNEVVLISHRDGKTVVARKVTKPNALKMRELVGVMVDDTGVAEFDFQDMQTVMESFSAKRLVKQQSATERVLGCVERGMQ